MQKRVNLVDLVKTQQLSNEYLVFPCTIWRRYSRERASQSSPKTSQTLAKLALLFAGQDRVRRRGQPGEDQGAQRGPGEPGRGLRGPDGGLGPRARAVP